MNNAMRDLDRNKEGALREVAELKVQLKMVEETRDAIRRDLIDANRYFYDYSRNLASVPCLVVYHV